MCSVIGQYNTGSEVGKLLTMELRRIAAEETEYRTGHPKRFRKHDEWAMVLMGKIVEWYDMGSSITDIAYHLRSRKIVCPWTGRPFGEPALWNLYRDEMVRRGRRAQNGATTPRTTRFGRAESKAIIVTLMRAGAIPAGGWNDERIT
jgi:hypothetical protein